MAALIIKVTSVAVDVTGQLVLWLLLLLMLPLTIWLPLVIVVIEVTTVRLLPCSLELPVFIFCCG